MTREEIDAAIAAITEERDTVRATAVQKLAQLEAELAQTTARFREVMEVTKEEGNLAIGSCNGRLALLEELRAKLDATSGVAADAATEVSPGT